MAEPGPRWVWVVRSCLRSFPDSAREWRITRGEYLVASRRLGSSPGHQAEVYGDCEMFAGDDVEVGRPRIILGGIRARGGVVGCFYERPCALNAREAFTHAGRLAVLVLNHGRPVGADHRLHQLGEILADPEIWPASTWPPPTPVGWSKTNVACCETRWIIGGP